MKKNGWTHLIAVVLTGLCLVGSIAYWDALDYPMPGIPEAPPTPFGHASWDRNEAVVTNLSRIQQRLRGNRYSRLKEKWIRELNFADTYWTFRSGTFAIHFGSDGNVRVRKPANQTPAELEAFGSFGRVHAKEILLFSERNGAGESTRIRISAINERSVMLVAPNNAPIAVLDRAASSSRFDRLAE